MSRATKHTGASALWDAKQLAQYLGVGINAVYGMAKNGTLPHVKFGNLYKFSQAAIDKWIAEQTGEAKK
jgi:excisionase family DNA binding protein